ncbi:hypothetical protein K9N68_09205 [Kovacikia minuta CCNUW1]|uniref:HD domain-containing protein n=1 Tax=Kovacikia minuta TaxID=2931930 RepID=UPI001CCF103C|nr:hypothetical protein [Kovacikia minuta]UBF28044.1 hypothetical protein K9N68_09205 [Kovacikia minuta CCNUW1]
MGNHESRWEKIWQKLQAPEVPRSLLKQLVRAYSAPNRFYHNLSHIQDCLSKFDHINALATDPAEVELAIWFHDAIYNPKRNDNEQRSAIWAKAAIAQAGLHPGIAERVSDLILATEHHTEVRGRDAQVMVDIDLSILGSEENIFWQYDANIRKEYAWVPDPIFKQKRIEILRGFLSRSSIYNLEEYQARFEEKARANLERAIVRWSSSRSDG